MSEQAPSPPQFNLTDEQRSKIHIVSGQVYPDLAKKTAEILGVPMREVELSSFSDGDLYVRHADTIRRRHVYVFQSHMQSPGFSIDSAIRQQNLLIRAAKEADAAEVTAVTPYLGYSRQDRKSRNREATSAAAIMEEYETARANRLVVVDLHAPQEQAFFRGVCIHLTAFFELNRIMRDIVERGDPEDICVVAPDTGRAPVARAHANHLGVKMALMWKSRDPRTKGLESVELLGDVKGKTCLVPEDITSTGSTLAEDGQALLRAGAASVIAFVTHAQFTAGAEERLGRNSPLEAIWVTDTLPQENNRGRIYGLEVIPISPLLAETIAKIETGDSIHAIYNEHHDS